MKGEDLLILEIRNFNKIFRIEEITRDQIDNKECNLLKMTLNKKEEDQENNLTIQTRKVILDLHRKTQFLQTMNQANQIFQLIKNKFLNKK